MLKKLTIKNFKSIQELSFDLGRVNVFIGENGSGKSNILEAIALGAAASKNKLDNEFLSNRGIRVPEPRFMRSAFTKNTASKEIDLRFECDNGKSASFNLTNDNQSYSVWKEVIYLNSPTDNTEKRSTIERGKFEEVLEEMLKNSSDSQLKKNLEIMLHNLRENYAGSEVCQNFENFLIFSPENSRLRNFQKEGQIEPLGRNGEGLFKLLKSFYQDPQKKHFLRLIELLKFFSWFKGFDIPPDLFEGENNISVFDKYIYSNSKTIDQRSTSEGFLYLLFYFSLAISDKTPNFFAIENIETALNPKLCTKVTTSLVDLSKEFNKQIILTTHNPAVLDGLNLDDSEQLLYVVYRNSEGHTTLKNYKKPQSVEGEDIIKLSEAFMRGYIGGLPKNFSI